MKNLKKLSAELAKLDDKLVKCMRCGTCQAVCPVFAETFSEGDVTRGKLALLSGLSKKILTDAQGVREKLDRCLLCGSCQSNCPSGVKIMEIFLCAREICAEYIGLSKIKKIIFRLILSNPKFFGFLVNCGAPLGKLFLRDEKNAPKTACSPLIKIAVGDRHIPLMPAKTFSNIHGEVRIPSGKSAITVVFFSGCMGDKVYTNVTEACLKIFKHFGVGTIIPKNFACCGIPALASGDAKAFQSMAEQNLDILKDEKFDYIVTACASCTETIKDLWLEKIRNSPREKLAEEVGKKAIDISEFLVDVLKVDAAEIQKSATKSSAKKMKLTYHDSCHLAKSLGVRQQPRKLLKMSREFDFVEMNQSDRCCGCGGSFTLTHYELSKKIGQRKRDNIVASRAETIAAGCPACMMQISNLLALNNDNIQVKHVAEIFADTLENGQ